MNYVLKYKQEIIFFNMQNIRAIVTLFFPIFFQIYFSDGKFIPSQLYLFIKELILLLFQNVSLFLHDLMWLLQRTENIYCDFLLMEFILALLFLSNQDNLYMIHHNSDLFYDIYNAINEHNQKQTHYFSSIPNYFNIYF